MGETREAKVRKVRIGIRKDMAQEMVLRIILLCEMFACYSDQTARLGTRWRKEKMQKRPQSSHTHLISSAFSTQLELGISDPLASKTSMPLSVCAK